MASNFTPHKSAFSRLWLVEGRARIDHDPLYEGCVKAGTPSQNFGDVDPIQCPDPNSYGNFTEVGEIQGAVERVSMSIMGRYAADVASDLLRIAKKRCDVDLHLLIGDCSDPRDENTFTKDVIFEKARLTNWSTDSDLGALSSDENSAVNEQSDISAREMYEVLQLSFAERGGDVVVNPLNDVVICDSPSCGTCGTESDGCQTIFAVGDSTPGSPGTAPDLVYTTDRGSTLAADDINTMTSSENGDGVACLGDYVVVVSNDSNSHHYKLITDVTAGTAGNWTEEGGGYVASCEPNDIWSVGNYAFIAADAGYVYGTSDATQDVTVLDAGVATTQNLLAVHALDENFAVAVGAANAVVYTENQTTWQSVTGPAPAIQLNCVWVKSEDEWWVGANNGTLWCTLNKGVSWTQASLPGSGYTSINDIAFSTDSVMYVACTVTGPRGRILRSYFGGNSFKILPEGSGTLPVSDAIYAIAACIHDPNFVVGVGLGDNAADGYYVVGQD